MPDRPDGLRNPLLAVIFVVVGIALAVAAITIDRQERRLRDGALEASARVVMVLGHGPLVRFVTAAGDHVDVTLPGSLLFSPKAGETIPIYYHPDNPSFAGLDTPFSRWFRTAAAAFLAIVAIAIGVRLLRASRPASERA